MTKMSPQALVLLCSCSLPACAATHGPATTPNKVVEMEALRIVAKHDDEGNYTFESYDAEELFQRANAELDAGRCKEAVPLYDRIAERVRGQPLRVGGLLQRGPVPRAARRPAGRARCTSRR